MPQGERFSLLSLAFLRSASARRSPEIIWRHLRSARALMSSLPWSKESVLPLAIALEDR